jgi:hypothetical protein
VPWIELDGAANVRDLGGLATQDGGETVAGRLLRGDNLQELSPADVARLIGEIGLTTVVDLRRSPTYAADITSRPAEEHRPRAQTMTAFLEQVRARYGGVTRWLTGHGFGREDLDRLHAKLRRP